MRQTYRKLKMICALSPFAQWCSTILDLSGEWTEPMVDAHDAQCPTTESGLRAWEGTCTVTTSKELPGHAAFSFKGEWRKLHAKEHADLANDYMPLAGRCFPSADEEDIEIPEANTSPLRESPAPSADPEIPSAPPP